MSNTIIVAICTVSASIVGALLANKLNISREERNEKKLEKSVLCSIESELKTLWRLFSEDLIKNLENIQENEIYTWIYTTRYDYFNIYNSSSFFVGKIKNAKLRCTIIETYIQAKNFLEKLINYGDEYKKFKLEKDQFLKTLNANLTFAVSNSNLEYLLQNSTAKSLSDLNINYTEEGLLNIEKNKNQVLNYLPELINRTSELKKAFNMLEKQYNICLTLFEEELK